MEYGRGASQRPYLFGSRPGEPRREHKRSSSSPSLLSFRLKDPSPQGVDYYCALVRTYKTSPIVREPFGIATRQNKQSKRSHRNDLPAHNPQPDEPKVCPAPARRKAPARKPKSTPKAKDVEVIEGAENTLMQWLHMDIRKTRPRKTSGDVFRFNLCHP